jgi:hypothetical protein
MARRRLPRATIWVVRLRVDVHAGGLVVVLALSGCAGNAASRDEPTDAALDASPKATPGDTDVGEAGGDPADGAAPEEDAAANQPPVDAGGPVPDGTAVRGDIDASVLDAPIAAPVDKWTWVPFSNAFCANGSPIGIGVNPSTTSTNVVVYFEGGGACWSEETCYVQKTAVYFSIAYNKANFVADTTSPAYMALPGGFFDRSAAANPFKDASYVYVPYCTGDLHGGSNVVQYGSVKAMHVGYQNFSAFLRRLAPTFASAGQVFLTGSSAGGDGALLNFGQTQRAFANAVVHVIDDSGTLMPADVEALGIAIEPSWRTQWNLAAALPAECEACSTTLAALYGYYAASYPKSRFSLLSYQDDSVIPAYYGITTAQFTDGLNEDLSTYFVPNANARSYVAGMFGHVLFFSPLLATNGTTVQDFVSQLATDDASWASVHP